MNRVDIPDHPLTGVTQRHLVSDMDDSVVRYKNGRMVEDGQGVTITKNETKKKKGMIQDVKKALRRRKHDDISQVEHEKGENLVAACRKHKIILANLLMLSFLW
jgi:hypothetical protein